MKKKTNKRVLSLALSVAMIFTLILPFGITEAQAASGTTYYVSFNNGSDSNEGTSESEAWKTLDKVNATTFRPGDTILFDNQSTWTGQLAPKGSGSAAAPIIISKYGSGDSKPLIQCQDMSWNPDFDYNEYNRPINRKYNAAVQFYNQQYWEITNLEITNFSATTRTFTTYNSSGNSTTRNNQITPKYGIIIIGHDVGILRHMYVKDCFVHAVNGQYSSAAGIGRGGINYIIRGTEVPTSWDDIIVEGNRVGDINDYANGLKVTAEQPSIGHYGVQFHGSYVGGSGTFPSESGINERRAGGAYSTNIIVRNNYFQDVGNAAICFGAVENGIAEYNVSDHCNSGLNGNVPIWWHDTKYVLCQYNEVFDSGASTSKEDSQAFDPDGDARYNVVQYNYTHDNPSGSIMECDLGTPYETHYRYNLSVNEGYGMNSFGNGAVITAQNSSSLGARFYAYNNDIFIGSGKTSLIATHWSGPNAHMPHWLFNNLIYDNGEGNASPDALGAAYTQNFLGSANFDHNYYGGTRANEVNPGPEKDANAISGGDLKIADLDANVERSLENVTGWEKINDYKRETGGVLENAGVNLPYNGGLDLYGNSVSTFGTPSIGTHETNADFNVPDGYTLLDFNEADRSLYNQTVDGVKFSTNGWQTKDNELAINKRGSEARSAKIIIPSGYTVYGFTARAKWTGKITASFNGKTKDFYLSDTKNSFVTDWTNLTHSDTTLTLDFQSPYGVENIRLDDLIITNQGPKVPEDAKVNAALGKLVHQSAGDNDAAYANDGLNTTAAGGNNASLPWTWEIDLGVIHKIDSIELEWAGEDVVQNWKYRIEYSNNNMDWGLLADYTVETPFENAVQNIDIGSKNARYFKVTVTDAPTDRDSKPGLSEFRAFGAVRSAIFGNDLAESKTANQNRGSSPAAQGNDNNPATAAGGDNTYSDTDPWIWAVEIDALQGKDIGKIEVEWPDLQGDAGSGAYNGREMPKDWKYKIQYTATGTLNDTYDNPQWIDLVDYSLRSPYTDYDMSTADWDEAEDPTKIQEYYMDISAKLMRILVYDAPIGASGASAAITAFRAFENQGTGIMDVAYQSFKSGEAIAQVDRWGWQNSATNSTDGAFNAIRRDYARWNPDPPDNHFQNSTGSGNKNPADGPLMWTLNLGDVYDISSVATAWEPMKFFAGPGTSGGQTVEAPEDWKYIIEYSMDGVNWETVVDYRTYNPYVEKTVAESLYQETSGLNIQAQYMRIQVTGRPDRGDPAKGNWGACGWYTVWQFRAFGVPSDSMVPPDNVAQGKYAYQNMSLNGRPEAPEDPIFAGKQLNVATAGLTGRASNAIDGSSTTYSGNTNLNDEHPEYWLAVDLDAKYSVYGFEVEWDDANKDWKYVIESSADGNTWNPVSGADYRASAHPESVSAFQKTTLTNGIVGQFFRLRVTGKHTEEDVPVRLAQFRVLGIKHSETGTNIALKKTATGMISNPGNAVDGSRAMMAGQNDTGKPWGLHGEGLQPVDLIVDLGAVYNVDEVFIEFEDLQLAPNYNFLTYEDLEASAGVNTTGYAIRTNTAKKHAEAMKYIVEYSENGKIWETLWDYSKGNPCVPVEIRKEIEDGQLEDIYDNNASVRQGWNYAPWKYDTSQESEVAARYVRVTMTGVPAEWRMAQYAITELSVFGTFDHYTDNNDQDSDIENIAYGKPVLPLGGATSNARLPEAVTDGKSTTDWTANGDALRIDLGLQYDIDSVTVMFDSTTPTTGNVIVKVSEDGNENVNDPCWETLGTEAVAAGAVKVYDRAAKAGRYLLVSVPSGAKVERVEAMGEEHSAESRSIMILGAHPDDEALLGAGVIKRAIDNGDDVYVLMGTNGDYNGTGNTGSGGQARMMETFNAMTYLGVPWDHIFFLSFPDTGGLDEFGMTGTSNYFLGSALYRLYMDEETPNAVIQGRSGATQTYNGSISGTQSYYDRILGGQVTYTRANFLNGMQDAFKRIQPDDIYTTSRYDLHGDHAAMGLFATEALVNLRKENPAYNPTLHETFVHSCSSDEKNNGNGWPKKTETVEPFGRPQGLDERTIFDWNCRESITVPELMRVFPYSSNMKDQALRKYSSQYSAWIGSFVKYDEIFWTRDFENLAFQASAAASSEKSAVRGAGKAINGVRDGESTSMKDSTPNNTSTYIRADHPNRYPTAEWVSNDEGDGAWMELDWSENLATINAVTLYDRPTNDVRITSGNLIFDDGTKIDVPALPSDGRPLTILVTPAKETKTLRFEVTSHTGSDDVGLAEIEVSGSLAPNTKKAITDFTLAGISGNIFEEEGTIEVTVPYGTEVTSLTPEIVHTGVSISPDGEQNFESPVTYTVSAADGSTKTYTVTVTVAQAPKTDITFTAEAADGAAGTADTTKIKLIFTPKVEGLNIGDITVSDGTAGKAAKVSVAKDTATTDGTVWILTVNTLQEGDITVAVASFGNYNVTAAAQTVTIYKDTITPNTDVTFTAEAVDGVAGTADTTKIKFTFTPEVEDLSIGDITVFEGTDGKAAKVSVAKDTVTTDGTVWILTVNTMQEGDVMVTVTNFGNYNVTTTPQAVAVYKDTRSAGVKPAITIASLPKGKVNAQYSQTLAADGDKPITWSIASGKLPDGLSLNSTSGLIFGKPTKAGIYNFTVKAANTAGEGTKEFSIIIDLQTFTVRFDTSGAGKVPQQTKASGETVTRPGNLKKSKYVFDGWYDGKTKVSFPYRVTKDVTLTAKWSKAKLPKVKSFKLTTPKKKQIKVTYKKVAGAAGYRIQISTNSKFKANATLSINNKKKTSKIISKFLKKKNLMSGKTYYVRVQAYRKDSTGKTVYGIVAKGKKKTK